jgi:hypothetical protein
MAVQACSRAATGRLAAAVVLEGGRVVGPGTGHGGAGVAGAEPSGGGQLASADRRTPALMVVRTIGQGIHAILPFSDLRPRFVDWGPVPS